MSFPYLLVLVTMLYLGCGYRYTVGHGLDSLVRRADVRRKRKSTAREKRGSADPTRKVKIPSEEVGSK